MGLGLGDLCFLQSSQLALHTGHNVVDVLAVGNVFLNSRDHRRRHIGHGFLGILDGGRLQRLLIEFVERGTHDLHVEFDQFSNPPNSTGCAATMVSTAAF